MKKRTINVCGFMVHVYGFSYASYYYPDFNGDAEFPVTSKGFRQLSHYLRTVKWADNLVQTAFI